MPQPQTLWARRTREPSIPKPKIYTLIQADLLVAGVEGESVIARLDHLVQDLGFRGSAMGFRVLGLGLTPAWSSSLLRTIARFVWARVQDSGFRV